MTNSLLWIDGTDIERETVYTRWGFRFDAPICKKSNSWRWAWIKAFGKLRVIRWTLPTIYWDNARNKRIIMENPWHIYMVQCGDGTLYTGITIDVKRRINEHNSGKGSKYCRSHGLPVTLLMSIEVGSKSLASQFEYKIKKLSREHKQQIIDAVIQAEHDKRLDAAYPLSFVEINKPEDYNKTISEHKSNFKGLLLYMELKTIIDLSKHYY